jgi:NAD+ synthetase
MIKDYESAVENIRAKLKRHIQEGNLKALIIGISGGVDSALCAALASSVCKDLGIPLIGRSITIQTNKKDEIERAKNVGSVFCDDFKENDLGSLFFDCSEELLGGDPIELTHEDKVTRGNIKARIRMMKLYSLAGIFKGMVLSTDNLTELYAGFWTLHGDVGDFGMIQNLWKTEVYAMTRYLAENEYSNNANVLNDCIDANPTDGLGVSNSDLDQLGVKTYAEADELFIEYFRFVTSNNFSEVDDEDNREEYENWYKKQEMEKHPLIQRYLKTQYKRENPYNIPRKDITDSLALDPTEKMLTRAA